MFKSFKLVFGLLFIISASNITAQTLIYSLQIGDTVVLNVSGQRGTIQWQKSNNKSTWTNISGATTSKYTVVTDTSSTGKRYFRAQVTDTSCPLTVSYASVIEHRIVTNTNQIQVGDWYHGGYVFDTDGTGHGLISPGVYFGGSTGYQFGCSGTNITSANSVTNGMANTAAILASCSARPIPASVCDSLTLNGYKDWFLPAKNEIDSLYFNRGSVGGNLGINCFWSSTNRDATTAWAEYFNSQGALWNNKVGSLLVTCIRSY